MGARTAAPGKVPGLCDLSLRTITQLRPLEFLVLYRGTHRGPHRSPDCDQCGRLQGPFPRSRPGVRAFRTFRALRVAGVGGVVGGGAGGGVGGGLVVLVGGGHGQVRQDLSLHL